MKFFPFESITYRSKMSSDKVLEKLEGVIEPKKFIRLEKIFGNNTDHKKYQGYLKKKIFRVTRIIGYQNAFLPLIYGVVEDVGQDTKIKMTMRLHVFVLFFSLAWMAGVGGTFLLLCVPKFGEETFKPALLVPLGMLLFGYVIAICSLTMKALNLKSIF